MANQWVIQELLAEKSDVLEWDTWVVGTIDDGCFLERLRTNKKAMAYLIVEILKWWETFEDGIISSPDKIKEDLIERFERLTPKKKPRIRKVNS